MTLREEVARKIAWALYGGHHGKPKLIDYAAADATLPLILSKAAEVAKTKFTTGDLKAAGCTIAREIEMLGEG